MLQDYAFLFIRKDFKIFTCCLLPPCHNIMCIHVRMRVCVAPYSRNRSWISPENMMPFVVEERGKGNIVHVRLLSRERLICISVACAIGNALITLPSCYIDAKSSQRKNVRLFAGIRCTLRYLTEAVYTSFQCSWF